MRVIKTINTSAAIAKDDSGHDVVVLGKGVGFRKPPYDIEDLSLIDRTFYDVDPKYVEMLGSITENVFLASADIVEQAEINLDCELNPNLPFTLADHLQFAIERLSQNIDITAPLAYDVRYLYPEEYELGELALDIMQDYTEVRLPDSEAVTIAMHLINAENRKNDEPAMLTIQVIGEIDDLIEKELKIRLDKDSYRYSRFTMHLRYLIQRLTYGKQIDDQNPQMYKTLAREYPEIYLCANKVAEMLQRQHNWTCTKEEVLYLMLHINRVKESD